MDRHIARHPALSSAGIKLQSHKKGNVARMIAQHAPALGIDPSSVKILTIPGER